MGSALNRQAVAVERHEERLLCLSLAGPVKPSLRFGHPESPFPWGRSCVSDARGRVKQAWAGATACGLVGQWWREGLTGAFDGRIAGDRRLPPGRRRRCAGSRSSGPEGGLHWRGSIRVIREHVFVMDANRRGAIAETKIAAAATVLGIPVMRPIVDHGRYDLAFEIGGRILRIQCKWGRLDEQEAVVNVNLQGCRHTPNGYVRSSYSAAEIDAVAVYCAQLDRCYLLPISLVAGRRAISLRLTPPLNGQRACINLETDFRLPGAVAQLEERMTGSHEAGGSSPPSSTRTPVEVGCHEFRNHFGYYLERAAAGDEIEIRRRGRPYARLIPASRAEPGLSPPTAPAPPPTTARAGRTRAPPE
jgi:prevent-host-death family protein